MVVAHRGTSFAWPNRHHVRRSRTGPSRGLPFRRRVDLRGTHDDSIAHPPPPHGKFFCNFRYVMYRPVDTCRYATSLRTAWTEHDIPALQPFVAPACARMDRPGVTLPTEVVLRPRTSADEPRTPGSGNPSASSCPRVRGWARPGAPNHPAHRRLVSRAPRRVRGWTAGRFPRTSLSTVVPARGRAAYDRQRALLVPPRVARMGRRRWRTSLRAARRT